MLSRRTDWDLSGSAFVRRLEALRALGRPLLDLTESNPTRCGLLWDEEELRRAIGAPGLSGYDPSPRGLPEARRAVAGYLAARGAAVEPDRIFLTASTSEAYGLLLKLLCDPGDEVLAPVPAYPLLDLLTGLEAVSLVRWPWRYAAGWHLDRAALEAAIGPRARAVVVVSPANPTGAVLSVGDLAWLDDLCARRGLALLGDEVFADAALAPAPSVAGARSCLAFHLSGLSKVCGLPQLKVAWLAAAGPERLVGPALERLEVAADAYLSVAGPAQRAVPRLLAGRESFLGPLRARLARNRERLAGACRGTLATPLAGGGGWSAVLRVGEARDDEVLALAVLEDGAVVHPGFLHDFDRPGHLVISLLPEPAVFDEGLSRLLRHLRVGPGGGSVL
ncbi:MAG TPA: pyridoxal phosphate-dependent aminotransferase [Anaeromyxobacteraceae bacterium]